MAVYICNEKLSDLEPFVDGIDEPGRKMFPMRLIIVSMLVRICDYSMGQPHKVATHLAMFTFLESLMMMKG